MKGRFLQFGGRIFFHKLTHTQQTQTVEHTPKTLRSFFRTHVTGVAIIATFYYYSHSSQPPDTHTHITQPLICHFPFSVVLIFLLFFVPFCFVSCFTFYYSMYVYRILFLSFCFSFSQCLCLFHSLLRALTLHLCLHSLVLSLSLFFILQ